MFRVAQQVDGRPWMEQAGNLQRFQRRAEQKAVYVSAANIFLNRTVVTFSLYLEVWLKYLYIFSI